MPTLGSKFRTSRPGADAGSSSQQRGGSGAPSTSSNSRAAGERERRGDRDDGGGGGGEEGGYQAGRLERVAVAATKQSLRAHALVLRRPTYIEGEEEGERLQRRSGYGFSTGVVTGEGAAGRRAKRHTFLLCLQGISRPP